MATIKQLAGMQRTFVSKWKYLSAAHQVSSQVHRNLWYNLRGAVSSFQRTCVFWSKAPLLGHEFSGGESRSNVTRDKVGDRVTIEPILASTTVATTLIPNLNFGGLAADGGFCQYCVPVVILSMCSRWLEL